MILVTDDNQALLDGDNDNEHRDKGRVVKCMANAWDELKGLLRGINPIDVDDWENKSIVSKFYEVFKVKNHCLFK